MKYFHKQRLLKLADYLRNQVKDKNFNLDYIGIKKGECVSCACALGNLPNCFPRGGFRLIPDDAWYNDNEGEKTYLTLFDKEDRFDFDVAENFFGISYSDSLHLFDPAEYPES